MAKRSKKEEFLNHFIPETSQDEMVFRKELDDLENEAYIRGYRDAIVISSQQIISRQDKEIQHLRLMVDRMALRLDLLEKSK